MSKPSIQNIDKWMFELHEGNLTPVQEKMLMDFIAIHPEYSVDLDAWKNAGIKAESIEYNPQALLKNKRKITPYYWGVLSAFVIGFGLGAYLFFSGKSQAKYSSTSLDLSLEEQIGRESLLAMDKKLKPEERQLDPRKSISENTNHSVNLEFSVPKQKDIAKQDFSSSNIETVEKREDNRSVENLYFSNELQSKLRLEEIVASLETTQNKVKDTQNEGDLATAEGGSQLEQTEMNTSATRNSSSSGKRAFTLKRALYEFSRDLKRTMNNPVALKNFRDQYYSLPSATGFSVNPSMAGTQVAPKFQGTTRAQYLGSASEQLSNSFSFDTYVYELKGGVGVDINHKIIGQGAVQIIEGAFTYSPKISLGEKFSFEPAMRFKFGNKKIDAEKLQMGSVIELDRGRPLQFFEEGQTPTGNSLWYRDVQVGFLLNTPWFYIGGSIDNVGRHFNNIYSNDLDKEFKANQLYQAQLGTDYKSRSQKTVLSTYALFQQQGTWQELWLGANVKFKNLHLGAAVSNKLDPAFSFGVDAKRVRFIYNTDYSMSQVNDARYLCHQLTLRYKLKPNRNARRILNM